MSTEIPEAIPLYLDWSFWAVVIAFIAVALSQMPPISQLLKKAKLELEAYTKISITHRMGNPNIQLHLILANIGGRKIRIKDINISLSRDGSSLGVFPAQNYLQNQNDQNTLLFTPFSLNPNNEWAHITNFLNFYNREEENQYQSIEASMIADYRKNAKELDAGKDGHEVEHPEELVKQALDFFNAKFIWEPGEYKMIVNITTDTENANISKEYRFTIFESHTDRLKMITDYYKLGGGIWYEPTKVQQGILLPVSEA